MIHEVSMPALSSTMEVGKIVSWSKTPGDTVEKGETILVVESDKADMDVESFHRGILATILIEAGSSAPVGSPIALIADTEAEVEQAKQKATTLKTSSAPPVTPATTSQPVTTQPKTNGKGQSVTRPLVQPAVAASASGRIIASPLAKKRATELGIDLHTVVGTGPHGRIVVADVEQAAISTPSVSKPTSAPPSHPTLVSQTVPLSTLQSAVVRTMMASLSVPTFRVGYTITTTALDQLYKQVKPKGVTMTALLAKAVAMTLERHPLLNAAYTEAGIQHKADINIAVAVAMEDGGLITPVLRAANTVDLYELSRRWKELVERSRQKQLQPDEYSTGSFTLSNLGMFGVDRFDAILPPQQGAILAIGASRPTVVATAEGAISVKSQMQVNITCDHRVIYGAHAAAFLQDLSTLLEQNVHSLTL